MYQLRCAASLSAFGSQLKQALKKAAASPATGVLVDTRYMVKPIDFSASAIRHLRKHLDELGLVLAATTFPTRRGFSDQRDLQPRIEAVRGALQFARDLGTDVVTLNIGTVPVVEPDQDSPGERDLLVDVLNDLARHGNHVGAVPVISVSASDLQSLQDLLADIVAGPIGVDFDPAAWTGRGVDPVSTFRELYSVVRHVWVRDAIRSADGTHREVPVGRGEVAWDEMLAVLAEAEYNGWVTAGASGGADPASDAIGALSMLQSITMG